MPGSLFQQLLVEERDAKTPVSPGLIVLGSQTESHGTWQSLPATVPKYLLICVWFYIFDWGEGNWHTEILVSRSPGYETIRA